MAEAIAVVSDLMFSSKIGGTARALGINAACVSTQEAMASALDVGNVRLVMVDMSLSRDEALGALRRGAGHGSRPTTVAFYSHVQAELGTAAEEAGADLVLTRSQFSAQLPELLSRHCRGATESG